MNEYSTLIIPLFALVGTMIGVVAQRRGKREDTHLDTSKWISESLRADNQEVRLEVKALREELAALRSENARLLALTLRIREVAGAETMGRFVDDWQIVMNATIAHPMGVHVAIYNDDIDETIALGHRVVPIEEVPPEVWPSSVAVGKHREALRRRAAEVRVASGFPAIIDEE